MNKNTLLTLAAIFCDISRTIIVIILIAFTVFVVHFQTNPSFYDDFKITKPENSSLIKFEREDVTGKEQVNLDSMKLSDWKAGSLYFTYFKFIAIFLLTYLSISQFQRVLKSVRTLETFKTTNVKAFRKIGIYCLIIAGLSWVNDWDFGNYHITRFSIDFSFLIISLLAFIFAEIFKEGTKLKEESELTI